MRAGRLLTLVSLLTGLLWTTTSGRAAPGEAAGPPVTVYLPYLANDWKPYAGPDLPFGYGWGAYNWRAYWPPLQRYPDTTFNWIKVSENPNPAELCGDFRLKYRVLFRLNQANAKTTVAQVAEATTYWAQSLIGNGQTGRCVDAFEIGNEPNLSMPGAFDGAVDPELYADQLCAAYKAVKAVDPGYVVVAAGLAPTAGLPDPTQALTDTVFLRRMLDRIRATEQGDAGACFDVLAYHNYGFRTGYATDPDSPACANRSCFRGVEAIHAILEDEYGVVKRIWATEIGWMRDFNAGGCGAAPWAWVFGGFGLSETGQADQLVGAYQYARWHWPWMGAMFVFNLDYDRRDQDVCADEQGWFAVKGYPAEAALEAMPKP